MALNAHIKSMSFRFYVLQGTYRRHEVKVGRTAHAHSVVPIVFRLQLLPQLIQIRSAISQGPESISESVQTSTCTQGTLGC